MLGNQRMYEIAGHGPYGNPNTVVRVFSNAYIDAVMTAKDYIARKEICSPEDVVIVRVCIVTEGL